MHLTRFKQDVARWIIPEAVSPIEQVTLGTTLKLLFRHMPLRAMLWYRLGAWCHDMGLPFFPGFVQRLLLRFFGLELAPGQDIAGGLYIAHPVGTVVSVARLGENCSIIANVTIGLRKKHAFPVIGDNVFIGAGARILGDIEVGNGAKIGANAVVIDNVPAHGTVVGIPGRVIDIAEPAGHET